MTENAIVRARIDEAIKAEASAVLSAMGLTVSDAFRMDDADRSREGPALRTACPQRETIQAMREARKGGLTRFKTVDALFADLNADD